MYEVEVVVVIERRGWVCRIGFVFRIGEKKSLRCFGEGDR